MADYRASSDHAIDNDQDNGVAIISRPRLGLSDVALQLWRAQWLFWLIFLPMFAAGMFMVLQMESKYTAYSRVQVALGREYIYDPVIGDAGKGATLEPEAVVQAEVERVYSPVLQRRVLEKVGLERMFPKVAEAMEKAKTDKERLKAEQSVYKLIEDNFGAGHAPKSPVIRVLFTHDNPEIAAEVTNAFVDEYLAYRSEISSDSEADAVSRQRKQFDGDLTKAEEALRAFMLTHKIGDFETEKTATATRRAAITDELYKVEAAIRESQGRLQSLEGLLLGTPSEIDLYVDTTSDQQLLDLQVEREQLLLRYRAESQPVREIDARIAAVSELLQSSTGGLRRRGPNPAYQDLQQQVATQSAEVSAARARATELRRQLVDIAQRQSDLITLQPEYQKLVREHAVLAESLRALASREQAKRAEAEISNLHGEDVTVLERAFVPTQGKSLKAPAAIAVLMVSGFTALMAALALALTRKWLSTPSSVERTLGLPVIGAVPRRG